MDLLQERENKVSKIESLIKEINEKEKHIDKLKKELRALKNKYNKEKESKLPILLFQINETLPMPDKETDWNFESIYYCPDIDEVKFINEHEKDKLLPNTIDLRKDFERFEVPKKKWPASAYEYYDIIYDAVAILKTKINNFVSLGINSWDELGLHLVGSSLEKGTEKIKKQNSFK